MRWSGDNMSWSDNMLLYDMRLHLRSLDNMVDLLDSNWGVSDDSLSDWGSASGNSDVRCLKVSLVSLHDFIDSSFSVQSHSYFLVGLNE